MTDPIKIDAFQLEGFRAYLKPQSFPLRRGKKALSLAVFAPNAKGKSALIDGFEFYFSDAAMLKRLGKRTMDRMAGRIAMEHVNARQKGLVPRVHFHFRQGKDVFDDERLVPAGERDVKPPPPAAARVLDNCILPFIIRGYELRGFVEEMTPEQRYAEISSWFGLEPFLEIQGNLRGLRRQVKEKAESTADRQERLRDLERITAKAVKAWDEAMVCTWFNDNVLADLDKTLKFAAISDNDPGYITLKERKAAEDETVGLATLKRILGQTVALYLSPGEEGEEPEGAIVAFESAITVHTAAVAAEEMERAKASQNVFSEVWKEAKARLEDPERPLKACPVCDTPFSDCPHGSLDAVKERLDAKLGELADYHTAEKNLEAAGESLTGAVQTLVNGLDTLCTSLEDTTYTAKAKPVETYRQVLEKWKAADKAPASAAAIKALIALHKAITKDKEAIEKKQGEHTYANALTKADELITLKSDLERIEQTKAEIVKLNEQLDLQALEINRSITGHTEKLIKSLKDDINTLYSDIQVDGADAPPIRLELPDQDDTNQQWIKLVIDFADNRKGVVPSGYLSDSQIHALALSLRLAAIRMFNTQAPIIVLDDVVTSYDTDHRKNIAAMLAKHFLDFQIILVTHDELFFLLLKDHLPQNAWLFRRITDIRPDFGPVYLDHKTPDEEIQKKLDGGESAANEIRQAEEEWLLDICRGFRAKVVIRPVERPYNYDRSELASALAAFLKGAGIKPPPVSGIANPFLASLQKGVVENFGSHFSDNPSAAGSIGDESARWAEFKYFRDLFACPECGKTRFMRPEPHVKPVCKKCETPFAFKVAGDD
ncbi:MAG: chromosome segregation protein SMC [Proteobacteria bacterium]|nr:chromosome segregation protein SMC [Pseudomonadota bacterium]